jgi:hypothetical protein
MKNRKEDPLNPLETIKLFEGLKKKECKKGDKGMEEMWG